jgi:hypothetical protein
MAHDVARAIIDVAAAEHAKDIATTLQRRSFTLELFRLYPCVRFAQVNISFDGLGMVHASLRRGMEAALSSMVVPESSLGYLVDCAFKMGWCQVTGHPMGITRLRNSTMVSTGVFTGKLVLRPVSQKGRPLLDMVLRAGSAVEMHQEVMAVVELAKSMQPAEQVQD